MDKLNKYQSGVVLIAVITGFLVGHIGVIADYSAKLIVPLLMAMLFGLFLTIDVSKLKSAFLHAKFSLTSLFINFIWTPVFAYLLGYIFLCNDLPLWMGFVMLLVTPCTDWYLVFTGIAKGNVPLSASILPANLILQVLLLPIYLMIFFGKSGNVELNALAESILFVLAVPFCLAWVAKQVFGTGKSGASIIQFFEKSQVLFLALAVVAMFGSQGKSLLDNPVVVYKLLIPILIFFAVTFVFSRAIGHALQFNYADKVSLVLTTMARNSPISLAIAVSAFPAEPLIALSLVIGPLIELPILVLASRMLLRNNY